jgi:hypothetical protein
VGFVSWTIAKEEVFRPLREPCERFTEGEYVFRGFLWVLEAISRKLAYIPTCEYCTSVWITGATLYLTRFSMLYEGWRGYAIAEFFIAGLANIGMRWFSRQGVENEKDKKIIKKVEKET